MKVKIEKTLVLGPGEVIEISNELYEKIKNSVSHIRDKPKKKAKNTDKNGVWFDPR